jgi:phosphotriesterase-related protein
MKRRAFISACAAVPLVRCVAASPTPAEDTGTVLTVSGPVAADSLGVSLVHEHVLVDFIGAGQVSRDRYDANEVFETALPHLVALRERGCRTLFEATPAYLGRDPALLVRLSAASGLRIVTNTGYYGAAKDKHVPAHAYDESARSLSERWRGEFENGIEGTGVRPGFLKIGVDAGPLSEIDRKLVEAAALCHLDTGLTIAVHTGDGTAALGIISALQALGTSPRAYVWVHAQNESDRAIHEQAARAGAWVEFDGVGWGKDEAHLDAVAEMSERGLLEHVLVSHDAGWYHVGEPGGGEYRPYTVVFDEFVPALRKRGFDEGNIRTLLVDNPARAFAIGVRPLEPPRSTP